MHVILLDKMLQFFVLATDLLLCLRVQTLLRKVDKDAPSPVLVLTRPTFSTLHLDPYQSSRHQKWHNILRLTNNLADFLAKALSLSLELFLASD